MRDKFDQMAWSKIVARKPSSNLHCKGLARSGRAANFEELAVDVVRRHGFQSPFADFLDEFYVFKSADFFDKEPPMCFSAKARALLAGTAEFLCHFMNLPVPSWTEKPEYFLPEEWDRTGDLLKNHENVEVRRSKATPEFKRRNILFNARGLIRL